MTRRPSAPLREMIAAVIVAAIELAAVAAIVWLFASTGRR
jgi:hypothetical protein